MALLPVYQEKPSLWRNTTHPCPSKTEVLPAFWSYSEHISATTLLPYGSFLGQHVLPRALTKSHSQNEKPSCEMQLSIMLFNYHGAAATSFQ